MEGLRIKEYCYLKEPSHQSKFVRESKIVNKQKKRSEESEKWKAANNKWGAG
jgi:hypothetical protein